MVANKKVIIISLVLVLLVFAGIGGYFLGYSMGTKSQTAQTPSQTTQTKEQSTTSKEYKNPFDSPSSSTNPFRQLTGQ